jgi:alkylation response protein AidB-like acyl-CoA dehydrogenase
MFPADLFGKGLSPEFAAVVDQELDALGAPAMPGGVGPTMAAPVIFQWGTDEQKRRLVGPIARGEEFWCQFFSEPGAGSDLAGIQTRAVLDGDEWIVNGQKLWSSGAQHADRGILLARTDSNVPKHRGISYFIIDVCQAGIEIRPLRQLTGASHFNEVFFTDARVASSDLVGGVDNGWAVAMSTLGHERTIGVAGSRQTQGFEYVASIRERRVADLLDEVRNRHDEIEFPMASAAPLISLAQRLGRADDPVLRQDLMRLYAMEATAGYTQLRVAADRRAGRPPGPESSLGYLDGVRRARASRDLVFGILGANGTVMGPDGVDGGAAVMMALSTLSHGIQGGAEQIQRNILGERVLGLPKEPQVDRDVPFRELKIGTQRG